MRETAIVKSGVSPLLSLLGRRRRRCPFFAPLLFKFLAYLLTKSDQVLCDQFLCLLWGHCVWSLWRKYKAAATVTLHDHLTTHKVALADHAIEHNLPVAKDGVVLLALDTHCAVNELAHDLP